MTKRKASNLVQEIKQALKPEFDAINRRFDRIEIRLDSHDKKFDEIDKKLDAIDKRLDSHDKRFDSHDKNFENIDNKFISIDDRFLALETKYSDLHETMMAFRMESFEHYDKIYNRLDFFKDEYYAILAGLKRIEDDHKIIDHTTILKEIQALKSRNFN